MCFSPKSNNIEMCTSISKHILLHLKFDVTKMEKEKKFVKNLQRKWMFHNPHLNQVGIHVCKREKN
jgi:hypothetical protein